MMNIENRLVTADTQFYFFHEVSGKTGIPRFLLDGVNTQSTYGEAIDIIDKNMFEHDYTTGADLLIEDEDGEEWIHIGEFVNLKDL